MTSILVFVKRRIVAIPLLITSILCLFRSGNSQGTPHYDITYTGGTWASNGSAGPISGPYLGTYGAGTWTGGGDPGPPPVGALGPGSCSCTGMITATFVWNNGGDSANLPPQVVLIKETSSASWYGDSGSCSDGLGDTPVNSQHGQLSAGVRWTARPSPGKTFSITLSPSAQAMIGENSPAGPAGSSQVSYQAQATPVRIAFSGVVDPLRDKRLVTGQQLAATIAYDGEVPPGQTYSYSWSVSGCSPFASYTATAALGKLFPYVPGTEQTTSCYFAREGSAKIGCSVTISTNSIPLLTFSLADTVGTKGPDLKLVNAFIGTFRLLNGNVEVFQNPNRFQLVNPPHSGGFSILGMVADPSYPLTTWPGTWNYTQLVCPNAWTVDGDGHRTDWPNNGLWGLDGDFPTPPSANYSTGELQGQLQEFYDSPGFKDDPNSGGQGINSMSLLHYDAQFRLYVMYKPPGTSQWIPRALVNWNVSDEATQSSGTWSYGQRVNLIDPNFVYYPDHPEWTITH